MPQLSTGETVGVLIGYDGKRLSVAVQNFDDQFFQFGGPANCPEFMQEIGKVCAERMIPGFTWEHVTIIRQQLVEFFGEFAYEASRSVPVRVAS